MKLVHNRRSEMQEPPPPRPPLTWKFFLFWSAYAGLIIGLFAYACRRISP